MIPSTTAQLYMRNCYYHMPCPDPLAKINFASHYRSFQYSNITTPSSPTQFPSSSFPPKSHHPSISCWGTRYLDGQWFGWVHQRLLKAPALWKLSSSPKHGSKATKNGWKLTLGAPNSAWKLYNFQVRTLSEVQVDQTLPTGRFSESFYMNPKDLVHFVLVGSTPRVLWVYIRGSNIPSLHQKVLDSSHSSNSKKRVFAPAEEQYQKITASWCIWCKLGISAPS